MPSYSQGQIVEVSFRLPPGGDYKEHPVIILSNEEINQDEEGFVAVMMTSNRADDEYSFEVTDNMVTVSYNDKKYREIRLHLIGYFLNSDIISNGQPRRLIKKEHLKRIVSQINMITFDFNISIN